MQGPFKLLTSSFSQVHQLRETNPRSKLTVLMHSYELTMGPGFVTGSLSLSATKRMTLMGIPVIISSSLNAGQLVKSKEETRVGLHIATLVGSGVGSMIQFMSSHLLDNEERSDRLLLVQVQLITGFLVLFCFLENEVRSDLLLLVQVQLITGFLLLFS